MIIARLFSYTRLLERQAARERVRHRVEVAQLKAELKEWQNRLLEKANVRPLYKPEPKPTEPIEKPPIGPTQKRLHLASQNKLDNESTAEQILAAAENASRKAG